MFSTLNDAYVHFPNLYEKLDKAYDVHFQTAQVTPFTTCSGHYEPDYGMFVMNNPDEISKCEQQALREDYTSMKDCLKGRLKGTKTGVLINCPPENQVEPYAYLDDVCGMTSPINSAPNVSEGYVGYEHAKSMTTRPWTYYLKRINEYKKYEY